MAQPIKYNLGSLEQEIFGKQRLEAKSQSRSEFPLLISKEKKAVFTINEDSYFERQMGLGKGYIDEILSNNKALRKSLTKLRKKSSSPRNKVVLPKAPAYAVPPSAHARSASGDTDSSLDLYSVPAQKPEPQFDDFLDLPIDLVGQMQGNETSEETIERMQEQNIVLRQLLERFDLLVRVMQSEDYNYSPELWSTLTSLCKCWE